ncbi:GNAT family N-acetyltransferase [Lapillicoccus jejuensis]|uniref:Acetyltransferase (GNAT) family protein n=1 Tax=Lapillicoccus jejuensis TaxID=402171 RepID=A0A542DZF3_9MICO|nr:GNAT family N-acetyltransferase [Lapillicoccus jejuensis]TQJ08467.1 acetyltransferase (GNAT) family protein [Lapillicoccus jejuensis]
MAHPSPPDRLEVAGTTFTVDRASRDDVAGIVALLHDDAVAAGRESPDDLAPYLLAFERVDADPAHQLVVVHDPDGGLAATLQLTVVPGLSRRGTTRVVVEAVRVAPDRRGGGLGGALLGWAERWALARGATLVQLTTDVRRTDAHRFYERLGYVASHVGFKKELTAG